MSGSETGFKPVVGSRVRKISAEGIGLPIPKEFAESEDIEIGDAYTPVTQGDLLVFVPLDDLEVDVDA